MGKVFKPGDRVKYSRRFLHTIQGGVLCSMRGTVLLSKIIGSKSITRVKWNDGTESSALTNNLASAIRG